MVAEQLVFDYRQAELSSPDRMLCDYAAKLSLAPNQMTASDIEPLRAIGWSDEQIHHATQVIGYFNYINRVAEGLHVDPEEWMTPNCDEWKSKKANYRNE